jgi:hypothetical protein
MDTTSPLNNNNETSSAGNNKNNPRAESEMDLLSYSKAMSNNTPSALPQPSGFKGLESSLPLLTNNNGGPGTLTVVLAF